MSKKGLWAIMLAATMLIGTSGIANAANPQNTPKDSLQEIIENLEEGYSEYYDISGRSVSLCSSEEVDGNIENLYMLELNAILRANSVEDMDYYQGITAYCTSAINETATVQMSADLSQLHSDMLSSQISDIYENLNSYIGKEQELIFFIKETYPINNDTQKEILFENGPDYVSWEEMLPASHNELRTSGYIVMANIDSDVMAAIENPEAVLFSQTSSYSSSDAVEYMTTYTSNPTSCNVCSTSCTMLVDTTKYNPEYSHYVSEGNHVDCANYVSQALKAGGIPEDDTWKAGSASWKGVAKLISYMDGKKYWSSVSYLNVSVGDIIKFSNSHVAMITAFDGVHYKYSGHTNDRNNANITIKSTYTYYRVKETLP